MISHTLKQSIRTLAAIFTIILVITCAVPAQNVNDDTGIDQLHQAAIAIGEGRLSTAETILNAILAKSPRDADALNLLGVVRAQQRKIENAEKLFLSALAAQPKHIGARVNLGELYFNSGRGEEALQILSFAYKLAPERLDVNLHLATVYESRSQHELALKHLQLIPVNAREGDYFQLMLRALLGVKRLTDLRTLVTAIKQTDKISPAGQAQCSMLLAGAGLQDWALELLRVARDRNPNSFEVLYATGVIYALAKQYQIAEDSLNAALQLQPDDVPTIRALARIARARGELEKSLSHLVHARRVAPEDAAVSYDFGVTALQMDLYLDALPVFVQLHQRFPQESIYLYALGAARLRSGEKNEAARILESYTSVRPEDPSGFYLLGATLYGLRRFDEAQTALERSLKLKVDSDTEYFLGLCLYERGNRKDAFESFRRVIQQQPKHAGALAALGVAYREEGKYAEARTMFEQSIALNPKDLRAHYQLGLVYAKLGDTERAQKEFARADELRGAERVQETLVLKLVDSP